MPSMPTSQHKKNNQSNKGKLRIGDNWNAITIIALSQNNPLKAIAEFVENSIDAKARNVTIIRGKANSQQYLKIIDDGEGICRDENGIPNFKFVATHICDSIKRRLKHEDLKDIQGEFGIGLLSFWTVGEKLILVSAGADGHSYQMEMTKGDPGYTIAQRRSLIPAHGTELIVTPLLPGLRLLNGEKIQRYLASELRDRIRKTDVKIKVIDRFARAEYKVEPRQFSGQLLHHLSAMTTPRGEIYVELYLNESSLENQIGLYRSGTRVLPSLTQLDCFQDEPWTSGYFQGIIDAPFLNLTPGTRDGIIQDENFSCLSEALQSTEEKLTVIIAKQLKAQEERSSHHILRTVQKAFKEAFLILPQEEYDWFEIYPKGAGQHKSSFSPPLSVPSSVKMNATDGSGTFNESPAEDAVQKQFFEFAGPLYSVLISPASCVVPVKSSKNFRAISRDRKRQSVEKNLTFLWELIEGDGALENKESEIATFTSPAEPGFMPFARNGAPGRNRLYRRGRHYGYRFSASRSAFQFGQRKKGPARIHSSAGARRNVAFTV